MNQEPFDETPDIQHEPIPPPPSNLLLPAVALVLLAILAAAAYYLLVYQPEAELKQAARKTPATSPEPVTPPNTQPAPVASNTSPTDTLPAENADAPEIPLAMPAAENPFTQTSWVLEGTQKATLSFTTGGTLLLSENGVANTLNYTLAGDGVAKTTGNTISTFILALDNESLTEKRGATARLWRNASMENTTAPALPASPAAQVGRNVTGGATGSAPRVAENASGANPSANVAAQFGTTRARFLKTIETSCEQTRATVKSKLNSLIVRAERTGDTELEAALRRALVSLDENGYFFAPNPNPENWQADRTMLGGHPRCEFLRQQQRMDKATLDAERNALSRFRYEFSDLRRKARTAGDAELVAEIADAEQGITMEFFARKPWSFRLADLRPDGKFQTDGTCRINGSQNRWKIIHENGKTGIHITGWRVGNYYLTSDRNRLVSAETGEVFLYRR
ncbi:MAG: hypothetical protein LBR07_00970 [Puniceicoccales bacterium]|jgi:hypothetical protein|nr:hypothetical protein [Puniceicoccales bacterium]